MNLNEIEKSLTFYLSKVNDWLLSPSFYIQIGFIVLSVSVAWLIAKALRKRIPVFQDSVPDETWSWLGKFSHQSRQLLFPLLNISMLGVLREAGQYLGDTIWLIIIAQLLAVIFFLYHLILRFVKNPIIRGFFKWVLIPIAVLKVFGVLDEVTVYLDGLSLELGNIKLSAYALARAVVFGVLLFWLGRISSDTGQKIIRNQQELDNETKEIFIKIFQVVLSVIIFILLLQIVGINLTALAVFSGALGVGLGFGLQSIASNFVSGLILLLDRSLKIGDFVELEDSRSGVIDKLNMRSATLTTYDGKDIVVPNDTFITNSFTNWTHRDKKQRYPLYFSVAYDTDLEKLFEIVREVVASHPQVLSGNDIPIEERPDAEISQFGDFGIEILVEFWMIGIDDGKNRVGADLLFMIWQALQANGIEIPFPQREIRILNPSAKV
ncbi:MAG: mechanosensitive ion channel domain-containing protein [Arenicellales bacterium]